MTHAHENTKADEQRPTSTIQAHLYSAGWKLKTQNHTSLCMHSEYYRKQLNNCTKPKMLANRKAPSAAKLLN